MFIDKFNKAKKFVETTLTERISESIRKGVDELLDSFMNDINAQIIVKKQATIEIRITYRDDYYFIVNVKTSNFDENINITIDTSDIEMDVDCYIVICNTILTDVFINKIADEAIMNKFSGATIYRLNHEEFYKNYKKDDLKFCVKYLIGTPETSLADLLFTNLTPKIN
jgi:hypothetical protein